METRKLRILVISLEVWRNDTNGGNTLSNLFNHDEYEFAQIYCSHGTPDNTICKKYFQLTDFMMISNIIKGARVGRKLEYADFPAYLRLPDERERADIKRFYRFFRMNRLRVFEAIRELIWKQANWDTESLKEFVLDFDPDVIFAPCYALNYMLRISRFISEMTGKKLVSYISDDIYSLKQFSLSPVYWVNRLVLRHNIRTTAKKYSLVYIMTQPQIDEYKSYFPFQVKLLMKGGRFAGETDKTTVNNPIHMVFAGNIFCGRWKTLSHIGDVLRDINSNGIRIQLNIYTQSVITTKLKNKLHDGRNIILYGPVNQQALGEIYKSSDIALHVESFDLRFRLQTRLSFSTKIIDCLQSGRAIMAIAWKKHAGLKYLKAENAAICIDSLREVEASLKKIADNPHLIISYAKMGWNCGKRNHQLANMQVAMKNDLVRLIAKS